MGIFDTVIGEFFCPFCGATLDSFQVKDLKSSASTFEALLPVDTNFPSREMHVSCEKCKSWVSINIGEANLKQLR